MKLKPLRLHQPRRKPFGTTWRDMERRNNPECGLNHPRHPFFSIVLRKTNVDIHKQLLDGAKSFRAGEALAGEDDPELQEAATQLMRLGLTTQLSAVVALCHRHIDYRFADAINVLVQHGEHLLDLTRGIQQPYLEKARPNGNPHPTQRVMLKADCIVALDWLEDNCGFSPKQAADMVLNRVKGLKKPTLQGWGKPDRRARMRKEIELANDSLRQHVRLCERNDVRGVLDSFLDVHAPKQEKRDFLTMTDDTAKEGFQYIDALAKK